MEFLDRHVLRLSEMILKTGTLTGPWATKNIPHDEILRLYTEYAACCKLEKDIVLSAAFAAIIDDTEKVVLFVKKGEQATVLLRTQRKFFDDDMKSMLYKLYGYKPPNTKVYSTQMRMPEYIEPKDHDAMHVWCVRKSIGVCHE